MKDINSIAANGVLFDGRYKLLRPLSSDGGTADVWLALDLNTVDEVYDDKDDRLISVEETGIKVAIKIYRPKNALDMGEQRFREEFKIVFNCHHTNLVQPINFSIYEGIPYLVLPYCQKGSSEKLQGRINDNDELWRYISDVSAGLAYLHAFNPTIVHHDIKPANVLVDDNENFAITDFGISSHRGLNREGYDENQSGTMAYMAPERFRDEYESIPESDIWSFGATLYELITGRVPFGENGGWEQLQNHKSVPAIEQSIPNDIKNLINDCLSPDITKRPSAEYINKAAQAKEYPVKNKTKLLIAGGVILLAIIVAVVLFIRPEDKPVPVVSMDDRYMQAMELVSSDNADNLRKGLSVLDSLGKLSYVPALYEQALTYGWYSDSASVARKNLLGIDMYPEDTAVKYMPKSKDINDRAINLFSRIKDLKDERYPYINADALYRLACYYANDVVSDSKIVVKDERRAESLLNEALKWAQKSNDEKIRNRIIVGLGELNK